MIKNSDFSLGTYQTRATTALGGLTFYSAIRRTFSLLSGPPSPPAPLPQRGSGVGGEGGPQRGSGARGEGYPLGSENVRRMAE